ncbi:F-box protein CPR1-like [Rosa chinensis]|uniref:F-box protein CPR1-like n=1 Tax=Rosa chinensis TaxID=74649 RepID=UPI000D088326|nr:F-box protein CPR1-like [Rosa chinensis]
MAVYLPEHVIVQIMERLPIKSLIRFTSVSKRWRFIILSDPNFAKSQFQQTRSHRALCFDRRESEFESRDLETLWSTGDNSTDRKLRCPFKNPGDELRSLSSCNGLVCATLSHRSSIDLDIYIWNPSTQFYKKLPASPLRVQRVPYVRCYGFGYLSATGDFKVLIDNLYSLNIEHHNFSSNSNNLYSLNIERHSFSSNSNIWKRIAVPFRIQRDVAGTLSNEALHWIDKEILAFDLTHEKFRTMLLPDFKPGQCIMELGDFRGCLCALDCLNRRASFIDLWVMKEYNVSESWTKLFTLKISDRPVRMRSLRLIMVMETGTVLEKAPISEGRDCDTEFKLIKSGHKEEKFETHKVSRKLYGYTIGYEESLLWVGDHSTEPAMWN